MKNSVGNIRSSNLELLRILCMLMIVMGHLCQGVIGGANYDIDQASLKILQFCSANGQMAANCFFLITGYFMNRKNKINLSTVGRLICTAVFYSYLLGLIFLLVDSSFVKETCSISDYLEIIFPVSCNQWWFISAYIGLYLIIPYLNRMIENNSEAEFSRLILILMVMMSVLPTLLMSGTWMSNFSWAITLYLAGAYINRYPMKINRIRTGWLAVITVSGMVLLGSSVVLLNMYPSILRKVGSDLHFRAMNQFPCLITSLSLFIWSTRWKIQCPTVNLCAKVTLGVYLIHMNILMKQVIWKQLAALKILFSKPGFTLFTILIVPILVYSVCAIIDFARNKIFEKVEHLLWRRVA